MTWGLLLFILSRRCRPSPHSFFSSHKGRPNVSLSPPPPVSPLRVSRRAELSGAKSQSTSQFVTALVFNAAVFAIQVVAFTLVRPYFRAIYEPRSYIPLESFVFLSDPFPHIQISSLDGSDQETRPTTVPKYLCLATRDMEG